jgi:hypothetical protein
MTAEERARALKELRELVATYSQTPVETFERRELGAELDFSPLRPAFVSIHQASVKLEALPLEALPDRLVENAHQQYAVITNRINHLNGFSVRNNTNPAHSREQLIGNFVSDANGFFDTIPQVVAYASLLSPDGREALAVEAQQRSGEIRQLADDARTQANRIAELLRASQDAAQKVGISEHAQHFLTQAREHLLSGRYWLWATMAFAVITGLVAGVNYAIAVDASRPSAPGAAVTVQAGTAASIQLIVAKVLLFSLLLSATVWCGRVYRAHRHNYVVNRHRQHSLSSFKAFAESTEDTQTKNAVLIQATQSIFSPQSTGFISHEAEPSATPQLIELVRTIGNPAK